MTDDETYRIKWIGTDTADGFIDSQRDIRFDRPGTVRQVAPEAVREYISGPSANGFVPIDDVPSDISEALGTAAEATGAAGESVRHAGESLEAASIEAPTTLEDIEGVGPTKADALRDAGFDDVTSLQNLSLEDFAAVDGISESLAESIREQLGQPFADTTV